MVITPKLPLEVPGSRDILVLSKLSMLTLATMSWTAWLRTSKGGGGGHSLAGGRGH